MEILVRHTITLDPAVIELLKGFSGGQQAPVKEMISSPEIKGSKSSKAAPKQETAKEEVKETPATQTTEKEVTNEKKLEYTDIRQLYLTKKEEGKQAEVKKLIDSYGVEKLSAIRPDQFREVYDKMIAI